MTKVNKKCKDTVFTKMFGDVDKEYLMQLYQALHPEDQSTGKDDLKIVTLENIFTNNVYNDLGFLAKNKLIVLVEAQSTWSVNILIRMLIYMGRTYRDYIYSDKELKRRLYSDEKITIPKPEMYVIYTGNKKDVPSVLSMKEEFFSGEDVGLEFYVKVIVEDKCEESKDIIWQYIMFCKVFNEQMHIHRRGLKAIPETIRICKEQGYLNDYLSLHEGEVENMLLWSKEEIEQDYRDLLVEEARKDERKKVMRETEDERKKLTLERDKYAEERDSFASENADLKARIAELESRLQAQKD